MKQDLYSLLKEAKSLDDLMRFQREVACQAGDYVAQYFHPLAKTSHEWVTQHYFDAKQRENVIWKKDGSQFVGCEKVEVVSEKVKQSIEKERLKWVNKMLALGEDDAAEANDKGGHESDGEWFPGMG